jgi:crossover junction endodeoxyribonuclease RuvC
MTKILGIDPGSRITGYGLILAEGSRARSLCAGAIRPREEPLPDRLHHIHRDLAALIAEHAPDLVAVETAFYHKSARSVLVLGHVRGVALLAARQAAIPVVEMAPREIKRAVTGNGNASKDQVAFMVRRILGLGESPQSDAADALAVALCHLHATRAQARFAAATGGAPVQRSAVNRRRASRIRIHR